jgi:hypothetical protein
MHLGLRTIGISIASGTHFISSSFDLLSGYIGWIAVAHLHSAVTVKPFQPLASLLEMYRLVQLRVR